MMTDYRLWSSSDGTPFPLPLAHSLLLCLTGPVLRQCRPKAALLELLLEAADSASFFLSSYFVCIFSDFCCCHCCLLIFLLRSHGGAGTIVSRSCCQSARYSSSPRSWMLCRQHQWSLLREYSTQSPSEVPHIQSQAQHFLLPPRLVLAAGCPSTYSASRGRDFSRSRWCCSCVNCAKRCLKLGAGWREPGGNS